MAEELSNEEIERRVAKGAALLDEKVLDWPLRVNPSRLAMSTCYACVLGQLDLNGELFLGGLDFLELKPGEAAEYGFSSPFVKRLSPPRGFWGKLGTAWKREIKRRRQAGRSKAVKAD
jgi:hypothetical protein